MKKLVFAVAALGLISLTSCKKDYTCTCKFLGTETKAEIKNAKKSDAKKSCDALNAQAITVDGSCSL